MINKFETIAYIKVPLASINKTHMRSNDIAMPHKTCTLPNGQKVVQMFLLTRTKWKDVLVDFNDVGIEVGCG